MLNDRSKRPRRQQQGDYSDEDEQTERTLAPTPALGFLGAAVFLVTPAGLAALVVEAAGVAVGEALAFLGLVVRLIAGSVSTCWKTRGSIHTCQHSKKSQYFPMKCLHI